MDERDLFDLCHKPSQQSDREKPGVRADSMIVSPQDPDEEVERGRRRKRHRISCAEQVQRREPQNVNFTIFFSLRSMVGVAGDHIHLIAHSNKILREFIGHLLKSTNPWRKPGGKDNNMIFFDTFRYSIS
ncbi:hypothetical protein RJ40_07425 [Methanofollis aquaemaris]|uniref:Uncharacterized protein n=1 Tax=Methanofollis aquaemaris TaxID=126734 RepID=A0A8A3S5J9_9EURY|nr:hypothetical protein RJ40_07425 [Methanofollis aquaemaris]